ncbi:lysosomal-trafficking regulator-like [Ornithodoros turicata]|uniref:lysosomal-trafficking regulator-like n=1 Tax=Ornithodoros turicata TaxID=34597 RepID=UPI003139366C
MDDSKRKISRELKQLWHTLNSVPSNRKQLQEKLLDVFLAKLITQYRDVPYSNRLTEWVSAGNLLAHMLLSDVSRACEEGDSAVCKYLQHGRGWKLLWVLIRIGVEVLPCARELAQVMVSMLSLFALWETSAQDGFACEVDLVALDQCGSTRHAFPGNYHEIEPRQRKFRHSIRRPAVQASLSSSSSSSSASSDSDEKQHSIPLALLKRSISFLLPFKGTGSKREALESATEGEDQQTWAVQHSDDDNKNINCLLSDIPITEKEIDMQDAKASPLFLMRCILEVVRQVCGSEMQNDRSCAALLVSSSALPQALHLLNSLCRTSEGQPLVHSVIGTENTVLVSRTVLRLVLTSASTLLGNSYNLRDVASKDLDLVYCLLDAAQEQKKMRRDILALEIILTALLIVRDVCCCFPARNGNIGLLIGTVQTLCQSDSTDLIGAILASQKSNVPAVFKALAETVLGLKRIRTLYENRRRNCVSSYHHGDILGRVGRHSIKNPVPSCSVAAVCHAILKVGKTTETHAAVVWSLERCGFCCCLNLDDVCATLLDQFEHLPEEVRCDVLRLLEGSLYKQLSRQHAGSQCSTCSSPGLSAPITMSSYDRLVTSADDSVAVQVRTHLLHVIGMACNDFKLLLYSEVILPLFFSSCAGDKPVLCELSELALPNFVLSALSMSGPEVIRLFASESQNLNLLIGFLRTCRADAERHLAIGLLEVVVRCTLQDENPSSELDVLQMFFDFLAEQTKGYCSISKVISVQSLTSNFSLRSPDVSNEKSDQLAFLCDLWSSCKRMAKHGVVRRFLATGRCSGEGYFLLMRLVDELVENEEPSRVLFVTVDALLGLYLQTCPVQLWTHEKCLSRAELVREMRNRLYCYTGKSMRDRRLLLDVLIGNLVYCTSSKVPPSSCTEYLRTPQHLRETDQSFSSVDVDGTSFRLDSGYEADLEACTEDTQLCSRVAPSTQIDSSIICYEEMCGLVLDMLCRLYSHHDGVDSHEVALHVIRRLEALCTQHTLMLDVLYRKNAINKMCHAFTHLLSFPESSIKDLQESLVNLLVMLCKHKTSSEDLKSYFQLFKGSKPAFAILLGGLIRLIGLAEEGPQCCLRFPVAVTEELSTDSDDEIVVLLSCCNAALPQELCEEFPWHLRSEYERSKNNVWTTAAGALLLGSDGSWSPFKECFSLAFWLRLRPPPVYSSSLLHVASVGSDELLLEMWVVPLHGSVVLRMSQGTNIVSELTFPNILPLGLWHHVGLTYKETSAGSPYLAQVTVLVDGHRKYTGSLCFEAVEEISNHPFFVALGHGRAKFGGSLELGNLLFFRGYLLTMQESFTIYADGPDQCSITPCALTSTNLPPVLNLSSEFLQPELPFSLLSGNRKDSMAILQEKLFLSYSPLSSNIFSVHPQVAMTSGLSSAISSAFRPMSDSARASHRIPVTRAVLQLETFRVMYKHQFHQALCNLGGVAVFLFLVARVVECTSDEMSQALALEALFKLLQQHPAHMTHFQEMDGLKLLAQVFRNAQWLASPSALRVAVNTCLSSPMLDYDATAPSKLRVVSSQSSTEDEAILVWPQLLCTILSNWSTGPGWTTVLKVTWALVRDRHPHRKFNLHQGAPLFLCLLTRIKEILLENDKWHLDRISVVLIVHILEAFVDDPLESNQVPSRLSACFDLALLLHKISDAYVCDTRSAFYFFPPSQCLTSESPVTRPWSPALYAVTDVSSPCSSDQEVKYDASEKDFTHGEDGAVLEGLPAMPGSDSIAHNAHESVEGGASITDKNLQFLYGHNDASSLVPLTNIQHSERDMSWSIPRTLSSTSTMTLSLTTVGTNEPGQPTGPCSFGSTLKGRHRTTQPYSTVDSSSLWDEEFQTEVSENGGVVMLVQGLLRLTCNILMTSPKPMVCQKLEPVLRPEVLIVLALNSSPSVSNEILCVLDAYLAKASQELLTRFLRVKGFQLLGAQLSRHPASEALVRSCFGLFLGRRVMFDRPVALEAVPEHPIRRAASVLVLSVLPQTAYDLKLCSATLHFLWQICNAVDGAAKVLSNNNVGESLVYLICLLPHNNTRSSGVFPKDIVEDILELLRVIVLQTCRFVTRSSKKLSLDCFYTLSDLFASQLSLHSSKCGNASEGCIPVFRSCQAILFSAVLDLLRSYHSGVYRSSSWSQSIIEGFTALGSAPLDYMSFSSSSDLVLGGPSDHLATSSPVSEVPQVEHNAPPAAVLSRELHNIFLQACDFVLYKCMKFDGSSHELSLTSNLVKMAVVGTALKASKKKKHMHPLERMTYSLRGSYKSQLGQLCCHLLSPTQDPHLRLQIVKDLCSCNDYEDAILSLSQLENNTTSLLVGFTQELLHEHASKTCAEDCTVVEKLLKTLRKCSSTVPGPHALQNLSVSELENQWKTQWAQGRDSWHSKEKSHIGRYKSRVKKLESKASKASVEATHMTRAVVELLNALHKEFVLATKTRQGRDVAIKQAWCRLANALTHERAVWYFPECFPKAWELDPTEGPSRVRRRLRRCFLQLDKRFLLPEFQGNIGPKRAMPLEFLYSSEFADMHSSAFLHHLHVKERITYTCRCKKICPSTEMSGEVLLGEKAVQFVPDILGIQKGHLGVVHAAHDIWNFEDIKQVFLRRYQLQDSALEVFLRTGVTALLAFDTTAERNEMCTRLKGCVPPIQVSLSESLESATQSWQERHLTNFEYLTLLNKLAGRSFNDLMQYPVFPFVLAEYDAHHIDLLDAASFRKLSRPMAVQEKKWESYFISKYKVDPTSEANVLPFMGPCHYRSHYSNSGTVLHFLIRLPPFTQMFLAYQDNNFDFPDRTFHNLHTTWRLASSESTTDVKELIPEFFFLPDFLANGNGFNFGVRQNEETVGDVTLPLWCRGDPRLFVLVHRQALESAIVTEQLGHWIDLIFGYKQTGKAAEEAINVFHPATYYGVDINLVMDPLTEDALKTMIRTYGQMPKQLFHSPHPLVNLSVRGPPKNPTQQAVMQEVKGLQWGRFVGSPAEAEPHLVILLTGNSVGSLQALLTNDVWGLMPNNCLLLAYNQESGSSTSSICVVSTALVSWGHPDNIVRIKLKKEPVPLLQSPPFDSVCLCSAAADCKLLFVGYTSGLVTAFSVNITANKVQQMSSPVSLLAHSQPITSIQICKAFSIVVTASRDGSCIVWDLNRLSYVCTVEQDSNPVEHVCVSNTLGDIAMVKAVGDTDHSIMKVSTINGVAVGQVDTAVPITSLCYSCAPEGISVNVIAAGMANGRIMLWSSWDLSLVREIMSDQSDIPIVSLTYSQDNKYLYAVNTEGTVLIWEQQSKSETKLPRFHMFH